MTIEELYLWAKANGYEHHDIEVMLNDGSYYSSRLEDVVIENSSILL